MTVKPLILGIGMNKTGTSSLTAALYTLGFPCLHSAGVVKRYAKHNRQLGRPPLEGLTDKFDAFCDSPINYMFKELDAAYPGSRFILTVRDLDKWVPSRMSQFGGSSTLHLQKWNDHVGAVREYFAKRPEDLLEYPLCDGAGWAPLCEFLGLEVPGKPFPWKNRTGKKRLARFEAMAKRRSRG